MTASKFRMLRISAAFAAAAGLLLTVGSIGATSDAVARMRRRTDDYAKVQKLAMEKQDAQAALAVRVALGGDQAAPLQDLLAAAIPGVAPHLQQREEKAVGPGWSVRSVEVTLDDTPLADVGKLVEDAAKARPPWRLAECTITASDLAGNGRAVLLFEALERKETDEGRGAREDSTPPDARPSPARRSPEGEGGTPET